MPASRQQPPTFVPDGLLPEGTHGRMDIRHRDVADPMPNSKGPPGQRIRVAGNINRDVLEYEFGFGRISEGAYFQGRILQQALEIKGGSGQSQWMEGDKVDAGSLVAMAIARNIDRATIANQAIAHCLVTLGIKQGPVVIACLRSPMTWPEVAASIGRPGPRGQRYASTMFRDGLEGLAEHPFK